MMGAMDARNMYSNLVVNKHPHTVASCWNSSTYDYQNKQEPTNFTSNKQNLAPSEFHLISE
jgi:hypothetical protein